MGPKAGLSYVEKRKLFAPYREAKSESLALLSIV
jgi:hypothetical protein